MYNVIPTWAEPSASLARWPEDSSRGGDPGPRLTWWLNKRGRGLMMEEGDVRDDTRDDLRNNNDDDILCSWSVIHDNTEMSEKVFYCW